MLLASPQRLCWPAREELVIDGSACDAISSASRRGAKRVAAEYWIKYGEAATKRRAWSDWLRYAN